MITKLFYIILCIHTAITEIIWNKSEFFVGVSEKSCTFASSKINKV